MSRGLQSVGQTDGQTGRIIAANTRYISMLAFALKNRGKGVPCCFRESSALCMRKLITVYIPALPASDTYNTGNE